MSYLFFAVYLVIYPMLVSEASVGMNKILMFALFLIIVFMWGLEQLFKGRSFFLKSEFFWLYLFVLYLCFSKMVGYDISNIDWLRDIVPILNLLLLPVVTEYAHGKNQKMLLYLFFIPFCISMLKLCSWSLSEYGLPSGNLYSLVPISLLRLPPPIGVVIGLVMYTRMKSGNRFWMIFTLFNILNTILSPGRAHWISAFGGILLVLWITKLYSLKQLFFLTGVLIFSFIILNTVVNPDVFIQTQSAEFSTLSDLSSDLSWQNRVAEYEQCKDIFFSNPFLGKGFGYEYEFWRPFIVGIGPGYLSTNFTHADIMFIASKGGLAGLFLFSIMIFKIAQQLYLRYKDETMSLLESTWAIAGFVALLTALLLSFSNPVFQTRATIFPLVVILGMGLGYKEKRVADR